MTSSISLRIPAHFSSSEKSSSSKATSIPAIDEIAGSWFLTRTSVPFWKDKRNVVVTFTKVESNNHFATLDNITTYQTLSSDKVKTVHGIDTPAQGEPAFYDWRGCGWLRIASSRWEIVGYGVTDDDGAWLLVYSHAFIFTSSGLILYSRKKNGLLEDVWASIQAALGELQVEAITDLAGNMFQVKSD